MELQKKTKIALCLCALPGLFLIVSGLSLLFNSTISSGIFDIHDESLLLGNPMTLGMGLRQFAIGLMIVVLALTREVKGLSTVMLIGAIVPLADFFIFASTIGWVSSLRHAAPAPAILGLGIYLLVQSKTMRI